MKQIELPKALEQYRSIFEQSIKPYVKIEAKKGKTLPWESKFGGNPYLPIGYDYPKDKEGNPLFLLAQINFEEIPHIVPFPTKGLLQFYISPYDGVYGLDFEDPTNQENFKIIYIPEIIKDEKTIIQDFSLPEIDEYYPPVTAEHKLTFELDYMPVTIDDFQFDELLDDKIHEIINSMSDKEEVNKFYEQFSIYGHRIGGYAYFTQYDPRQYAYHDYKILLLQMDIDEEIMWGDSGVGQFFIREEDLKNLDFSKVLYNWDCL